MTDLLSQEQTQRDSLPDGWAKASFGDLADYLNGRAFKKSEWGPTGRPIIRIQNLTGSSATLNRFSEPVEERYIVRDGDLLISWSATLGAYIYRGEEAVLNQHIFKVQPYVDRRFLFYLTDAYIEELRRQAHGSGMQHITKSKFENSEVPLPPLNEQRRIVEKIEELFAKLDAGVRALEETRALLGKYRRSVLKAAVDGELSREWRETHGGGIERASALLSRILQERREKFAGKKYREPASPDTSKLPALPEGWEWATIEQLSQVVTDGDHNPPKRVKQGIPHLTARNVVNWTLTEKNCTFISEADFERVRRRYEPAANDVIITCVGTVGRTAIVPNSYTFSADRNLAVARLLPGGMSPQFLLFNLNTASAQQKMQSASGSTAQPHFYLNDIRAFPVALAPLAEQQVITQEVERRLSVVDKIEATVEANLKRAGGLRRSILERAFSGRLVEQDPEDEPAEALLERIRAERQATKQKAGKRKATKDDEAQGRLI